MTRKSKKTAACQISKRRAATPAPSGSNTSKVMKRERSRRGPVQKSSIYKGVTFYKRTGRWETHIWNQRKQLYLGASFTAQQAARAYDRAAIHFRGVEAELNFDKHDYMLESKQLMEISATDLVIMLRKQSVGKGKALPTYPTAPVTPSALLRRSRPNESSVLRKKIAVTAPTQAMYTAPAVGYTRGESSKGTRCNKNFEFSSNAMVANDGCVSTLMILAAAAAAAATGEAVRHRWSIL